MKSGALVLPEDLPTNITRPSPVRIDSMDVEIPEEGFSFDKLEKNVLRKAIERAGGNKSKAAALLGITRRKLYSRMEILGIEK